MLFPLGAFLTAAAFFLPDVPFALALLPLFAGLWSGTGPVRFTAMTSFMIWPVMLCAWGIYGVEPGRSDLIVPLAVGLVLALGLLAARIGILPTTLLVTLIPVFPASPVLPLAALMPGLGLAGPFTVMLLLALIEAIHAPPLRRLLLGTVAFCLITWAVGHELIQTHLAERSHAGNPAPRSEWREIPEPAAITERGRWIALRDQFPDGATLILGENVFAQEDTEALAFWCHAATTRGITAYIGVSEPYRSSTRGAVWRLDPDSCNTVGRHPSAFVIHRAGLGIPHLTGTWGMMQAGRDPTQSAPPAPGIDWLICLEAFLPWAWIGLLVETAPEFPPDPASRPPIIVLSNDQAFRPLPALRVTPAFAPPPVHVLRRKSARAMTALANRHIHFAETGRSLLIRNGKG
ncbi:hypothetical protein [Ruegeria sp.]|uniref:hypothetical protein n=1 Tax=Ruegeria sp. TaxID=1879320 RepID=UPI003B00D425